MRGAALRRRGRRRRLPTRRKRQNKIPSNLGRGVWEPHGPLFVCRGHEKRRIRTCFPVRHRRYNVFVVKRTCTAAPRFLRHETGMMPVASPTKICKSRYFSTEAGALQKDLQGKGDAHEQYSASLHLAFHCIDAFHGILRYAQVKAKPPCSWRYIGGLGFMRLYSA